MKIRLGLLLVLMVLTVMLPTSLVATSAAPASDVIDDFEDGNADGWINAVSGGTATVTVQKGDTPDGSAYCGVVNFSGGADWQYVLKTDEKFGPAWKANGRNALRMWVKNDPKNPKFERNDRFQVQFRETDAGDRWGWQLGDLLNTKEGWQQIIVPFSALVAGGSGGNKIFELEGMTDFRLYGRYLPGPVSVLIDKIELITQ